MSTTNVGALVTETLGRLLHLSLEHIRVNNALFGKLCAIEAKLDTLLAPITGQELPGSFDHADLAGMAVDPISIGVKGYETEG